MATQYDTAAPSGGNNAIAAMTKQYTDARLQAFRELMRQHLHALANPGAVGIGVGTEALPPLMTADARLQASFAPLPAFAQPHASVPMTDASGWEDDPNPLLRLAYGWSPPGR